MFGSGLMNLFETVYASTAVSHMLSGKAIARAIRGHFLVDTALTALILSNIYGIPVPKTEVCSEDCADENYNHLKNVQMKIITRLMILLKFKFMTRATPKKYLKLSIC